MSPPTDFQTTRVTSLADPSPLQPTSQSSSRRVREMQISDLSPCPARCLSAYASHACQLSTVNCCISPHVPCPMSPCPLKRPRPRSTGRSLPPISAPPPSDFSPTNTEEDTRAHGSLSVTVTHGLLIELHPHVRAREPTNPRTHEPTNPRTHELTEHARHGNGSGLSQMRHQYWCLSSMYVHTHAAVPRVVRNFKRFTVEPWCRRLA